MNEDELREHKNIRVVNMGAGWTWYENRPRGYMANHYFKNKEAAIESANKFLGINTKTYLWYADEV